MSATRFVAVALATLLAATGVAVATPVGPIPTQQAAGASGGVDTGAAVAAGGAAEPAVDADSTGVSETSDDGRASMSEARDGANANERGPTGTLPAPVPDHVHETHDTIESFLSGALDGRLGEVLSELLGSENDAQVNGGESTEAAAPSASR